MAVETSTRFPHPGDPPRHFSRRLKRHVYWSRQGIGKLVVPSVVLLFITLIGLSVTDESPSRVIGAALLFYAMTLWSSLRRLSKTRERIHILENGAAVLGRIRRIGNAGRRNTATFLFEVEFEYELESYTRVFHTTDRSITAYEQFDPIWVIVLDGDTDNAEVWPPPEAMEEA